MRFVKDERTGEEQRSPITGIGAGGAVSTHLVPIYVHPTIQKHFHYINVTPPGREQQVFSVDGTAFFFDQLLRKLATTMS